MAPHAHVVVAGGPGAGGLKFFGQISVYATIVSTIDNMAASGLFLGVHRHPRGLCLTTLSMTRGQEPAHDHRPTGTRARDHSDRVARQPSHVLFQPVLRITTRATPDSGSSSSSTKT